MKDDSNFPNLSRRKFMTQSVVASGAAVLGAGALVTQNAQAAQTIDSKAHVVIVGSGLGGQAAAHRLRKQLPNAKITVVDGKKDHIYQPGLTLVGTGIWDDSRNVELGSNASLLPAGVDLIAEGVAEFKPEQNQLVTTGGQTVQYDFMVVATGAQHHGQQSQYLQTAKRIYARGGQQVRIKVKQTPHSNHKGATVQRHHPCP